MRSLRLRPLASRTSSERLSGQWLIAARSAWVICAVLLLVNFVASIPAYYHLMSAVCPLANQGDCLDNSGQLAATTVQTLTNLHLSLSSYAAAFTIANVLFSLVTWSVGLLIFWRKSDEVMGLLVSLLLVIYGATGGFNSLLGLWAPAHPSLFISLLLNLLSGAEWIGLGAFLLTFPTGSFAPRWSWLIFSCWIISFIGGLTPWPFLQITGFPALGGSLFLMVYRYVRVFNPVQRQQAKWVIYAAVVGLSLFTISLTISSSGFVPADSPLQLVFPAFTVLVPSALLFPGLGLAMLRYRLWDIDIIINKTLVYGLLTSLLALIYVCLIVGLQALTHALTAQKGDNPILIVASTLVIAALFQPLRRRIQALIDRRFYRRQYNAQKTIDAFRSIMHVEADLDQLCEQVVMVVQETMQPSQISLWLLPRERSSFSPEDGEEALLA